MIDSRHSKWAVVSCTAAIVLGAAPSARAQVACGSLVSVPNTLQPKGGCDGSQGIPCFNGPANLACSLQDLTNFVDVVTKAVGSITSVINSINSVENIIGMLMGTPNPTAQILSIVQQLQTEISDFRSDVDREISGTDFQIALGNANAALYGPQGGIVTLYNDLVSASPAAQPVSMATAQEQLRGDIDILAESTMFTHAVADGSLSVAVSPGAQNIGGTPYSSAGGVPSAWTVLDQSAVSSLNQVYDWRVGVPMLLTGITMALMTAQRIDPNYRSDGLFTADFTLALNSLEANLATMIDGVRCGLNTDAPQYNPPGVPPVLLPGAWFDSPTWEYGCVDIYSGYSQTYVPKRNAGTNTSPSVKTVLDDFTGMLGANKPPIQSVGGNGPVLAANCGQAMNFQGTNASNCDALADAYTQRITASARNAVLGQLPLHAMRELINTLTEVINPAGATANSQGIGTSQWLGCGSTYHVGLPGDTGCKGTSDIMKVPLALPGVDIEVAFNGGPSFDTLSPSWASWVDPTESVPSTPYNFVNSWIGSAKQIVSGDFNGDGRWDIGLAGGFQWQSIPIAHAIGDGTYFVTNQPTGIHFSTISQLMNGAPVGGIECGFGTFAVANGAAPYCDRTNYRPQTTSSDPVVDCSLSAVSSGGNGSSCTSAQINEGSFGGIQHVVSRRQPYVADFNALSNQTGVTAVTGDYNGDGFSDIALVGGTGWTTIPVAFGDGGGLFSDVTNYASVNIVWPAVGQTTYPPQNGFFEEACPGCPSTITLNSFPQWAATAGTRAVGGDFNGDGASDLALVESSGRIDVAFSNGDGTFRVTQTPFFPSDWLTGGGAQVKTGDFDADGKWDIALVGGAGWTSIPVAYSNGDGTFTMVNTTIDVDFRQRAVGAQLVTGDFDGDGRFDVASANDVTIGYTAYIPEELSGGRLGFAPTYELRFYVDGNVADDFWEVSGNTGGYGFLAMSAY